MSEQTTPELFDPAAHTVDDVNNHLADADDDERARVLALEDGPDGKGRATVIREFAPPEDLRTDLEREADEQAELARAERQTTKAATFAEAAAAQAEQPYAVPELQTTSTDTTDGGKGLTFAEQAVLARELYGDNPGVTKDTSEPIEKPES